MNDKSLYEQFDEARFSYDIEKISFVQFLIDSMLETEMYENFKDDAWNHLASCYADDFSCFNYIEDIDLEIRKILLEEGAIDSLEGEISYELADDLMEHVRNGSDYEEITKYMTDSDKERFLIEVEEQAYYEFTKLEEDACGNPMVIGGFYQYIEKFYEKPYNLGHGMSLNYHSFKEHLLNDGLINLDDDFYKDYDSRVKEIESIEEKVWYLYDEIEKYENGYCEKNKSTFKP